MLGRVFSSAATALACGLAGSACSASRSPDAPADASSLAEPSVDAAPLTVYVAYADDFTGFCHWSSAPATPSQPIPVGVHGPNPMTVYWKQPPPHDATQFPVGTIILKESNEAVATDRIVFAMVKREARDAGFNLTGANGWEWFSLQDEGDCTATILWRGIAAPMLTTYSDLLVGDCNGCHAMIAGNDYVWDSALQLSLFGAPPDAD